MMRSTFPDLRRLPQHFHDAFLQIVRGGTFVSIDMPDFGDIFSTDDVKAIHAYVIDKAHEDAQWREQPAWLRTIKTWWYDFVASIFALLADASSYSS